MYLSFSVIFIHASLRMRNMKNKMSKKIESLGLKRTPMGMILFTFGLEEQARSWLERMGFQLCSRRLLQGNEHTFRQRLEEVEGSWYHTPDNEVTIRQPYRSPSKLATWGILLKSLLPSRNKSFSNQSYQICSQSDDPVDLGQEAKEDDALITTQPKKIRFNYKPKLD